jgi:predicted MPP superfamily phosphohydrolase
MSRLFSRRAFLGSLVAAGAGTGIYARWGEPFWLEVTTRRAPVFGGDTARGAVARAARRALRVVQLSDLHVSPVVSLDFIAEAVGLALEQQPDLVLLTGDFVTRQCAELDRYAGILRPLSRAAPVFACAGNHDSGHWAENIHGYRDLAPVRGMLAAAGATFLQNDWRELTIAGRSLQLIAVGDLWSGLCQPAAAFAGLPPRRGAARVLLCHNPDAKELLIPYDWDLLVCGHTHGGQIKLPVIGTPFAPVRDKRFIAGLYRWRERWMFITRGVGNLHGVRFNCRPEISVLELG